ncbi:hypothetical protein JCM9140_819 [Halalkalibacter wakoensis JCM 9140]|uniref:Uncharacterized protein n=1 Tax=Halalkalibacter wakoensis JCM 9140 TaxID=1236970 RepID=W4Q0E9_9BACI|nr:hypothetical protein [Halalkalibacter wakoensis]GAE24859.1 hypothetical protein JCM9140_819 [Halalkalibacter wakoensis JCM 9140]
MAVSVNFAAVNINTQSNNSGLFIGSNNQTGWDGHTKFSFGNGQFLGMNGTANNMNIVNDTDVIDAPMNDQDVKPGVQNQQL